MTRRTSFIASSSGFTLLEVIVAFSITALSLGVLLAIFSTGLRNTRVAQEYSMAVALAESQLAQIGTTRPLEQAEWEGEVDENYHVRTEVSEYTAYSVPPVSRPPYRVTVHVSWPSFPRDRSVTLSTLRFLDGQ